MNLNRYKRQTTLEQITESGQQKLLNAKVLIVGCGGLGGELAVHLAAAGLGEIHIIDFDTIDISNLHRQVFFTEKDIAKPKTEVLKNYIFNLNSEVKVYAFQEKIIKSNIENYLSRVDFVLDCTDDIYTKYLVNDACVKYRKTLIYASLHKFEGHVAVFNAKPYLKERTTNLRDIFPEIPQNNIPTCSEVGTLNSIVSIIANWQANELYKLILGIGKTLENQLMILNSLDNEILKLKLKRNEKLNFEMLWQNNSYERDFCLKTELEINFKTLNTEKYKIISLIENIDLEVFLYSSLKEIQEQKLKLEDGSYCFVCQRGISSLKAAKIMQNQYKNSTFYSLKDGIK